MFLQDEDAGNGPNWESWIYNLSSNNMTKLDIWNGLGGSYFKCTVYLANQCYGFADDGVHGRELWKSNGLSMAGTSMVKDINPGNQGSSFSDIIVMNNNMYFIAWRDSDGFGLYKSDGTDSGTVLIKDLFSGTPNHMDNMDKIGSMVATSDKIFFVIKDATYGKELWVSDGTTAGTMIVKDIVPGSQGSYPSELTVLNNKVYFFASNDSYETSLWVSDGTASGTQKISDIYSHHSFEISGSGMVADNNLLFIELINYENAKREMWRSDGTASGTFLLKEGESMGEM